MNFRLLGTALILCALHIQCNNGSNVSNHQDMNKNPNRLINESSPYLLQHAYNPVDWYPWGDEAFEKAKAEDKLVLVSVGYSACHWCHVMEHETFEDSAAAEFMNQHFVCIKVDREERPDVDQVYMNAVQLMTRSGGWPLNCFTLADGRPIYGGTYFQTNQWLDVLASLIDLKQREPEKLEEYATNLTEGVRMSELIEKSTDSTEFSREEIKGIVDHWRNYWDLDLGGPNRAPKFPLPNNFEFLLQYGVLSGDKSVIDYTKTTLDRMVWGGIYDQIGGGFARYSTDINWKVPHFEKMLYDNAQLVSLYSKAYSYFQNEEYRNAVYESIEFVNRELKGKDGQFFSALDADSEGEEGKFYVWSEEELKDVLGANFEFFQSYYSIGSDSRWEGNHIPLRTRTDDSFCEEHNITLKDLDESKSEVKSVLMKIREDRIRPGLDDKSLTSWNALMITGLAEAYMVFGEESFLETAIECAEFIWEKQRQSDGGLYHSYKEGKSTINGYLEDYAFVIEAYISLYQSTLDDNWLRRSNQLLEYTIQHFSDPETEMFWFTSDLDPPLIARKQEISDNVIPASNSTMAKNLFMLGTYYNNQDYLEKAKQMLRNIRPHIDFGQSYSNWGMMILNEAYPFYEVAITGEGSSEKVREFKSNYSPNVLIMGGDKESELPLLEGKFLDETTIFVCQNKTCQLPVQEVSEAKKQLEW